jgi:hypothetical protein
MAGSRALPILVLACSPPAPPAPSSKPSPPVWSPEADADTDSDSDSDADSDTDADLAPGVVVVVRASSIDDGVVTADEEVPLPSPADQDNFGTRVAALGDLDGDGLPDLAVTSEGSGLQERVSIFAGSGLLGGAPAIATVDATWVTSLVPLGDLDGDGLDELAIGHGGASLATIWPGAALRGVLADGGAPVTVTNYGSDGDLMALGDLDRDGTDDLVVDISFGPAWIPGSALGASFGWNGGYAFLPAAPDLPSVATTSLGDVDGDGVNDVLVSVVPRGTYGRPADGWLVSGVRLADGVTHDESVAFGLLSREAVYADQLEATALGDLDGDGLGEVVIDGVLFTGATLVAAPAWAAGVELGAAAGLPCDLDGDGLPELVGAEILAGASLAAGVPASTRVDGIRGAPDACLGDLDGDGRAEILVASPSEDPAR